MRTVDLRSDGAKQIGEMGGGVVAGRSRRGPRRRHGWGALLLAGDRLSRDLEHHSPNRGYGDAEGTQANSPCTETGARNPRGRGSASNGGRKCSCRVWQWLARRRSHERENGEVQRLRKHHADLGDGSQTAERLRLAKITMAALLVFSARSEGEIEPRVWPHGFKIREIGKHGERLGVFAEVRLLLARKSRANRD